MANITMNNCRDLSNIKSQIPIIVLEENNSVQNLPKDPHKNIKIIKTFILVMMVIISIFGAGIYAKNHSINETYLFSGLFGLIIGVYSLVISKEEKEHE